MNIAIIEDHALFADLLAKLCRRDFKFDVVLVETQGLRALPVLRKLKPDLVLLDISLPDVDGLDIAKTILRDLPKTRILALSSLRAAVTMKRVRDLGIHGFVDKRIQNVGMLKEAIDMVSRGLGYFSPVFNETVGPLLRDPKAYYRAPAPRPRAPGRDCADHRDHRLGHAPGGRRVPGGGNERLCRKADHRR